jgi:hypothetical protein
MALFGKKKPKVDRTGLEVVFAVTAFSIARLKALDIDADVKPGTAGFETELVDTDGRVYNLQPLFQRVSSLPPAGINPLVVEYIDALVDALGGPPSTELTDEQLLERIRVRLQPEGIAKEPGFSYARPVTTGLVAVLCIDHPATIEYVNDEFLVGRNVVQLFNAGFTNVMAEPIEHTSEPMPGITRFIGDLFTATKALGMSQLIGSVLPAAPHGVLFAIPHRQVLFAHVLTGATAIQAVDDLGVLVRGNIGEDAPGGVLAPYIFYWRDSVIDVVAGFTAEGKLQVDGSGRFGTRLQELLAG